MKKENLKRSTITGRFLTKATPTVLNKMLELAKQGYSLNAIARELEISPATLRNWANEPELSELIETMKMYAQGYYENLARENMLNKELNATLLLGVMGKQFQNPVNIQLNQVNGDNVKVTITNDQKLGAFEKLCIMSDDEIAKLSDK